jgi:SAM-dependent methyltransferase
MGNPTEDITQYNRDRYEHFWRRARLLPPEVLPWWPVFKPLADASPNRLEIGPGLYPRLPVQGTNIVDLSGTALDVLSAAGAIAHRGLLHEQNFADSSMDLVGIFEVLEHVPDDEGLLREIARITRPGGRLTLSVPIGMRYFNVYDRFAGHVRRYEPDELRGKVERAGYVLERFVVHAGSPLGLFAYLVVWMLRYTPFLAAAIQEYGMLTFGRFIRVEWRESAEWESSTPHFPNCCAIFRRVDS